MPVPTSWIFDEINPGLNCSSERLLATLGPRSRIPRAVCRIKTWQVPVPPAAVDVPAAEEENAGDPPPLAADDCAGGIEALPQAECQPSAPPLCLSRCHWARMSSQYADDHEVENQQPRNSCHINTVQRAWPVPARPCALEAILRVTASTKTSNSAD
jgi:hypothetical protein